MAKKIFTVPYVVQERPSNRIDKQGRWGNQAWEPGMLPTGINRTKVNYDKRERAYGEQISVEGPRKNGDTPPIKVSK
jgi:hypothetical protein